MAVYSTSQNIPLSFIRIRSGQLVTGLTVTVRVVNALTGAQLLASTACPEIAGIYRYNWPHTISVFTEAVALYTVGGVIFAENITIDDSFEIEKSLEGRAI